MEEYLLKLDPTDRITSSTRISRKNQCAVKVKCTDNQLFLIQPPFGILNPEQSGSVNIVFNKIEKIPESGKHYVVVYYIKVNEDHKKAREFWKEHQGDAHGTKRLYIDFKEEDSRNKDSGEKNQSEEKE